MRTWFITGASRGFGALITAEVLAAGDAVVATARDPQGLQAKFGDHPRLLAVRLDVTREEQIQAAVEAAIQRFGRIDILVNNAGYGLLSAVEEASAKEVEHVINVSSVGGYGAYAGWGVYCATKFAVEGLTEALAVELAPLGIKATVVEPGFFRTDFLDGQSLSVAQPIADYAATSGVTRTVAGELNHAQPGNPAKLAKAFLALADAANPPLRLPLGSDTLARIEAKNRQVAEEVAAWRTLAVSTDGFDAKA